jgi:hypothetical protein
MGGPTFYQGTMCRSGPPGKRLFWTNADRQCGSPSECNFEFPSNGRLNSDHAYGVFLRFMTAGGTTATID